MGKIKKRLSLVCPLFCSKIIIPEFNNPDEQQRYGTYLKDWRVHKIFDDEVSSYYGAIYVNDQARQIVLAYRGTQIEGETKLQKLTGLVTRSDSDLQTDIIGIFGKNIVVQQIMAYVAAKEACSYAKDNNYSLSMTGHSLGAWLAEISAYYCYRDFDYPRVKTVNFDSPGSVAHMDSYNPNVRSHKTDIDIRNLDIVTYLSAQNFVNACNQHAGKVYRLFPEIARIEKLDRSLDWIYQIPAIGSKLKENEFLLNGFLSIAGHRLGPLLATFDPTTGKLVKYEEVLDWPTIQYTSQEVDVEHMVKIFLGKISKISKIAILDIAANFILNSFKSYPLLDKALKSDFTSNIASKTIASYITNKLVNIINTVSVISEFFKGNIDLSQHFKNFEYIEDRENKEGYPIIKQLSDRQEFSLKYEGHYRAVEVILSRDVLATSNKGNADWYLSRLSKHSIKDLQEQLDKLSSKQLINIKNQFEIEITGDGKKYNDLATKKWTN